MKLLRLVLIFFAAAGFAAGCAKKKKEITESARREAQLHVSEAQFALSVRDYARAEPLLAKAAELTPDVPGLWVELGKTRVRLNQRAAAKTAYREALAGFEELAKTRKTDPQWLSQQVTVLVLLGRVDEARVLLDKMLALFPDNRDVKAYVERKPVDAMLADPKVKELAL
jgi:Flp pilus assembly protein TadD